MNKLTNGGLNTTPQRISNFFSRGKSPNTVNDFLRTTHSSELHGEA